MMEKLLILCIVCIVATSLPNASQVLPTEEKSIENSLRLSSQRIFDVVRSLPPPASMAVLHSFDPLADNDGDRIPNLWEDLAGTDMEDSTDFPAPDIVVAADGSGDYTTLQAAWDDALDGDIILVKSGTYEGYAGYYDPKSILWLGERGISPPRIVQPDGWWWWSAVTAINGALAFDNFIFDAPMHGPALNVSSMQVRLSNCLFRGIRVIAFDDYDSNSRLLIEHCTGVRFFSDSGNSWDVAIFPALATVEIKNSILWSESPYNEISNTTNLTITDSAVRGHYPFWNYETADLLTPTGWLKNTSPAIGMCASSTSLFDIHNQARPDLLADAGCDQFTDCDSDELPDWWEDRYFDGDATGGSGNSNQDAYNNGAGETTGTTNHSGGQSANNGGGSPQSPKREYSVMFYLKSFDAGERLQLNVTTGAEVVATLETDNGQAVVERSLSLEKGKTYNVSLNTLWQHCTAQHTDDDIDSCPCHWKNPDYDPSDPESLAYIHSNCSHNVHWEVKIDGNPDSGQGAGNGDFFLVGKHWAMEGNLLGEWSKDANEIESLGVTLEPLGIGVDANRDSSVLIRTSGGADADTPWDETSVAKPFRFWKSERSQGKLKTIDDLQEMFFLKLDIPSAVYDKMATSNYDIGLKWKSRRNPTIRVFAAPNQASPSEHISDKDSATNQVQKYFEGKEFEGLQTVILTEKFQTQQFLIEGMSEGKGELCAVLLKNNTPVAESAGVWIEICNVKKMYQSIQVTGNIDPAYTSTSTTGSPDNPTLELEEVQFKKQSYNPSMGTSWEKTNDFLTFVHGWNMHPNESQAYAETMFKRLYHARYKGHFAYFRWPTFTGLATFNDSEYRAWKCGSMLNDFVTALPQNYRKHIVAHSMGNIVAGEALCDKFDDQGNKIVDGAKISTYIMMQAAVAGNSYWANAPTYSEFLTADASSPTPQNMNNLGYGNYLQDIASNSNTRVVNYYNPDDYALASAAIPIIDYDISWRRNQISFKPQTFTSSAYLYLNANSTGNPIPIGERCFFARDGNPPSICNVTDEHESMAFISRARAQAVGASNGNVNHIIISWHINLKEDHGFKPKKSDHSGQFLRPVQEVHNLYKEIMKHINRDD